jgi:hypothetical protein
MNIGEWGLYGTKELCVVVLWSCADGALCVRLEPRGYGITFYLEGITKTRGMWSESGTQWPISVMLSITRVRVIWFKNWCNFERLMQGFYVFFWLKLIVKTKYVLSSRGERNNYALYNIPSNFNTTKKFLRAFYEFL